jgi:LacI family transcriptional regulator
VNRKSGTAGRGGKAPTIGDVARHAGVSPMTVSRVINGETTVREPSRKRVEASVAELGYEPNEAARRLAGVSVASIALLYSKPSAYISEFLFGGLEEARKSHTRITVEKCNDDAEAESAIRRLVGSAIDGVLLPPPFGDSESLLDVLDELEIPTVAISSGRLRDSVSAVSVDDYQAARTMTEHIIRLGHRRIGFIVGDPHQHASAHRLSGYLDAMQGAGLATPEELVAPGTFTYRSGLDAAETLLGIDEAPTAIFASNDAMAAATVAVAHMKGLDVPGDLTVCGFDDTAFAVTIWPELTTIRQPIVDLSRTGADLLISKIRARKAGKKEKSRHVLLDFSLVRRQSDAAPRKRPRDGT